MTDPSTLHYICQPAEGRPHHPDTRVLSVQDFLADEGACSVLWGLVTTQFRTRGKFLSVWPSVRYVALCRDDAGECVGLLLISAQINWQIDYVVVRPDHRGRGIAMRLVDAAVAHAARLGIPYVMLTSGPHLRPFYERCGFRVVAAAESE